MLIIMLIIAHIYKGACFFFFFPTQKEIIVSLVTCIISFKDFRTDNRTGSIINIIYCYSWHLFGSELEVLVSDLVTRNYLFNIN
jgi:hypothetical protein